MTDPQLLILDEPFDGLDVNSRQQLAALLADLHSAGITLVLVLNRFDEIPGLCNSPACWLTAPSARPARSLPAAAGAGRPAGAQ